MAEKQIPGGAFVVETATKQAQIPGWQFINEVAAAAPGSNIVRGVKGMTGGMQSLSGGLA